MSPRPLLLLTAALLGPAIAAAAPNNTGTVEELRLDKFVQPDFPASVRAAGQQRGVVTVAIGRDAEGRVTDVLVLDSTDARLTEAVKEAVAEWRFARPANQPSTAGPVVPLVRFLFKAGGIAMVTPSAHAQGARNAETAPVILPTVAELDGEVKPMTQPLPQLRTAAPRPDVAASATVKYFIDETGHVRVPVVLEASSVEMGEAALHAIAQWRYPAPRVAGRPSLAIEIQTFRFAPSEEAAGATAK